MYYTKAFYLCLTCLLTNITYGQTLLNESFVGDFFVKDIAWADSHGVSDNFLGTGLLYYTITYMLKAKLCLCLGSGAGFVPQLMKQAQRDLRLNNARTILVDANIGKYGRPVWWNDKNHKFNKNFPDIEIIKDQTIHAAKDKAKYWVIDYLHIDADHSFEGCLKDFETYYPLMAPHSIVTLHDTGDCSEKTSGPGRVVITLKKRGYEIVDFNYLAAGVAIIHINKLSQ